MTVGHDVDRRGGSAAAIALNADPVADGVAPAVALRT